MSHRYEIIIIINMGHPQKLCVFQEALWNLKHAAVPLNKPASALPPASYTPGYSRIAVQRQWVTAWVYTAVTKITPTHSQRHPPVTALIFQCWRSDIWRHTCLTGELAPSVSLIELFALAAVTFDSWHSRLWFRAVCLRLSLHRWN